MWGSVWIGGEYRSERERLQPHYPRSGPNPDPRQGRVSLRAKMARMTHWVFLGWTPPDRSLSCIRALRPLYTLLQVRLGLEVADEAVKTRVERWSTSTHVDPPPSRMQEIAIEGCLRSLSLLIKTQRSEERNTEGHTRKLPKICSTLEAHRDQCMTRQIGGVKRAHVDVIKG